MPTTKEEAEAMKRMYVHGIFNMDDKDRKEGAIQYGGEDFLNNDVLVIKRQYSSVPAELVFTVFERLRAGVDIPSVFGASNASKAQVKVWELLNEYNKANPNEQVDLKHVAHSLGASGTKNAMNWAKAQGMQFDNTYFDGYVAGTSYPITNSTIGSKLTGGLFDQGYSEKGSTLFGAGKISYTAAPGDIVATGVGLPFTPGRWSLGIGNTDTTGNNFPRIPGRILTGDHNVAYYRDERVINFLNTGYNKESERNNIINYQKKTWGQVGPKTKVIKFNNKMLLNSEKGDE